jgi:hypothetical protein
VLEARQNWHRFRKLVGPLAPVKTGVVVLHSGNQILAGSIANSDPKVRSHFDDQGVSMEHPDGIWEMLAHKYQAANVSFVEREALLSMLTEFQRSKLPYPRQLEEIRNQILSPNAQRLRLIQHFGDRPTEQSWPKKHFFLRLFDSFFADLLPERKILLLVIKSAQANQLDTIALEFAGRELRNFMEPDWSNLDTGSLDIFHRESAQRMVLWCENHYMLPTFGVFVSENTWNEALSIFGRQGTRPAWRYWNRQKSQRDKDCELLMEPEPWPLKACVQWLGLKG